MFANVSSSIVRSACDKWSSIKARWFLWAVNMQASWYMAAAALSMGLVAWPASASGLCQAPVMHDGGQLQLTGSGSLRLGGDFAFSEVSKQGDDHCDARVQGTASYGLAGLPPGKSSLDYWMTIRNGQ